LSKYLFEHEKINLKFTEVNRVIEAFILLAEQRPVVFKKEPLFQAFLEYWQEKLKRMTKGAIVY